MNARVILFTVLFALVNTLNKLIPLIFWFQSLRLLLVLEFSNVIHHVKPMIMFQLVVVIIDIVVPITQVSELTIIDEEYEIYSIMKCATFTIFMLIWIWTKIISL